MVDLNTMLAPASGWTLTEGRDINELGQIVGLGTFGGQVARFPSEPGGFARLLFRVEPRQSHPGAECALALALGGGWCALGGWSQARPGGENCLGILLTGFAEPEQPPQTHSLGHRCRLVVSDWAVRGRFERIWRQQTHFSHL